MVSKMNRVIRIIVALACVALLSQFAVQAANLDLSAAGAYAGPYTGIANAGAISGATTIIAGGTITGGNLSTAGTLGVNGNVTLGDALTDSTNVSGTLAVAGTTTMTGALSANGGETILNGSAIYSGVSAGIGNRMIVDGTGASIGSQFSGLSITGATNDVSLVSDDDASALNARASLTMSPTSAALLVNTVDGVSHGLDIDQNRTILSGGTTSTTLTLDDSGATFENTDTGGPARVSGVADGRSSFDAVNVRQLNAVDSHLSSGIASIAALASIPTPICGKNYSAGLGYGHYNGESAYAIGLKANLPKSSVSLAAGVGFSTNSSPAANAGVSLSF